MTYLILDTGVIYEDADLRREHRLSSYRLLSERFGVGMEEAERLYQEKKASMREETGASPSGTLVMQALGIPPQEWEDYNYAHVDPASRLRRDDALVAAFERLRPEFRPVLFSNIGRRQAERTLGALGILDAFHLLYTVTDSGRVKPDVELLRTLVHDVLETTPDRCLCIGHREDVDLRPAEALGIPAQLVRSRDELIEFANARSVASG